MNALLDLRKIKIFASLLDISFYSNERLVDWPTFKIVDSIMALFRTDFSGRGELGERQQKVRHSILITQLHWTNGWVACTNAVSIIQIIWRIQCISVSTNDTRLSYKLYRSLSCSPTKFNVGVLLYFSAYTHFLVADPGATMTFIPGGALKPIGGHILSHASATRMYLRKGPWYLATPSLVHMLRVWNTCSGRAEERVAKLVDSPDRPESEASYKLDEGGWADV